MSNVIFTGMGKVLFLQESVCSYRGGGEGDTPIQPYRWRITPPPLGLMGYPPVRLGGGTPLRRDEDTPPPLSGWIWVPPPPPETEQHSQYLFRGGRYASCAHAGGLSCLKICFIFSSEDLLRWLYNFTSVEPNKGIIALKTVNFNF